MMIVRRFWADRVKNESYRASFEICSNSEDVFVECKDRFL